MKPLGSMQSGMLQSEATDPGLDEAVWVDAVGNIVVGDVGTRVGEAVGVDAVGNGAVEDD